MNTRLDELERVVGEIVGEFSTLRQKKTPSAAKDPSPALEEAIREMTEENRRLKDERKTFRKKVREIIKDIDRVNW